MRSTPIPAPGSYRIDPKSTTIAFDTRHMFGLGKVHGTFRLRDGGITIASPLSESAVEATIDAASVDTGIGRRDKDVRSRKFLDVENYPLITLAGNRVEPQGSGWRLTGSLTVRNTTRPVVVDIDQAEATSSGLHAHGTTTINRYDFGLTRMKGMAARDLTLTLDVTAHLAD